MVGSAALENEKSLAALSARRMGLVHAFAGCGCNLLHYIVLGLVRCEGVCDFGIGHSVDVEVASLGCHAVLALNCCTVMACVLAVQDGPDCVACSPELLA